MGHLGLVLCSMICYEFPVWLLLRANTNQTNPRVTYSAEKAHRTHFILPESNRYNLASLSDGF